MAKQVFFCGALLNHEGIKKYKGEGPAPSNWIRGFFLGLIANDIQVKCFSPIWDALFPKGRLFPGKKEYLDNLVPQVLVKYLNFPSLRTFFVAHSLQRAITKCLKNGDKPIAILTYNTYPYYCKALKMVIKKFPEIPWFVVVLDLDNPEKNNWQVFLNDSEGSRGCTFLSWWGYQNAPIENKHHMDCGWNGTLPEIKNNELKTFLYAGKYSKAGGLDEIINAITLFKDDNIVFEFYGKDHYPKLLELASDDKRVKVMGFVTDEELDIACQNATAFLSPREFDYQGTKMVFPSKILYYLKYRKPIISAMLPGLSPDYENLLVKPSENTPTAWAATMKEVLELSSTELAIIAEKTNTLLEKKKWKNQAASLINFIEMSK